MKTVLFALALISTSTFSGVKVSGLEHSGGVITIRTDGRSQDVPDLKVTGRVIEVTMDHADPFKYITKTISGTQLSASIWKGKAVVKAVVPFDLNPEKVNLSIKGKDIEITVPVVKEAAIQTPVVMEVKTQKTALNEDYLNKLMHEDKPAPKVDEVKIQQAAPAVSVTPAAPTGSKKNSDGFSFAGYALKFTIFLGMILGLFYGVVSLLKKGVFNKGKLGFLNNAQLIEVLSTSYVAPKRTMMIVRAHKQVFLVASSESGLTFLSELSDTSGLIKEGEKHITGSNFDLNMVAAEAAEIEKFKVKENIFESAPEREAPKALAKLASAKEDIVKFSDELKKKAKKLKPIEYN